MKKIFFAGLFGITLLAAGLSPAYGQTLQESMAKQNEAFAGKQGANVQARDPRIIVAHVIRVMLSLMGTFFVAYSVYAGYLIMTAAGEDDKITKAKSILQQSVIGIVVALSAYSIAFFVYGLIWKAEKNPFGDFETWGTTPDNSGFYNKDVLSQPIGIPPVENLPSCENNPSDPACSYNF